METTILTPDGIERTVLYNLFWNNTEDFLEVTQGLTSDCFSTKRLGRLYKVLCKRYMEKRPVNDFEMVVEDMIQLGEKDFTVEDIMQLNQNSAGGEAQMGISLREYVEKVIEYKERRDFYNLFVSLQQQVSDKSQDLPLLVSSAVDRLMNGFRSGKTETVLLTEQLDLLMQRIQDNRQGLVPPGLRTGFERLDRYGGLHPKDLVVIAADSSQGKTALAINMMMQAVKQSDCRAVVYSMEMGSLQLAARILSPETRLPAAVLTYKQLTDNTYSEVQTAVTGLKQYSDRVYFGDDSLQTIDSILSSIRLHHARYGITMAVVDYLQIIGYERRWNLKTEEALADAARRLKNIAKELGIVVILLSQINRDSSQGINLPSASRLRGSGQINEASDLTILIYRPWVYGVKHYPSPHENVEATKQNAMLKIDKDRHGSYGGIGSFLVNFDGATTKFSDYE